MSFAIILAIIIAVVAFLAALLVEFARGMATAPSQHPSYFWHVLIPGLVLALIVGSSHYWNMTW